MAIRQPRFIMQPRLLSGVQVALALLRHLDEGEPLLASELPLAPPGNPTLFRSTVQRVSLFRECAREVDPHEQSILEMFAAVSGNSNGLWLKHTPER